MHETWLNIKSNKIPNIIAVTTIAIALSIFGFFFLFLINFHSIIDSWEERVNIVLYLKEQSSKEDLKTIKNYLASKKEVDSISYISKERALEEFKTRIGDKKTILEGLETNPLPSSFVVKLKKDYRESIFIKDFVRDVRMLQAVEDIEYGRDWVEKFEIFTHIIQMITLVVGGLLGLASILIIYNTIKLTVYSRKEEIEIMKLVGATHRFIKGPFIIEGMIQGTIAALLSLLTLWILYKTFIVQITAPMGNLLGLKQILFFNIYLALIFIFISLILGTIGSSLAIGRVLKI